MIQGLEKAAAVSFKQAGLGGSALRVAGRVGRGMLAPWSFAPKRWSNLAKAIGAASYTSAGFGLGDIGYHAYKTYTDPASELLPRYVPEELKSKANEIIRPLMRSQQIPPQAVEKAKAEVKKLDSRYALPALEEIQKLKAPLIIRSLLASKLRRGYENEPVQSYGLDAIRSATPIGALITGFKHLLAQDPPEVARVKELIGRVPPEVYQTAKRYGEDRLTDVGQLFRGSPSRFDLEPERPR